MIRYHLGTRIKEKQKLTSSPYGARLTVMPVPYLTPSRKAWLLLWVLFGMLFFRFLLTELRCLLDSLTGSTVDRSYFHYLGLSLFPYCIQLKYQFGTTFYLLNIFGFQRNVLDPSINVTICREKQVEASHTDVVKRVQLNSRLEIQTGSRYNTEKVNDRVWT